MIGFGGGVEEFYAKERLATCEEKFRNNSLENLFLQYQLYGVKGFSEEQNKKFLQQLYEIIDFHKDNLINMGNSLFQSVLLMLFFDLIYFYHLCDKLLPYFQEFLR